MNENKTAQKERREKSERIALKVLAFLESENVSIAEARDAIEYLQGKLMGIAYHTLRRTKLDYSSKSSDSSGI